MTVLRDACPINRRNRKQCRNTMTFARTQFETRAQHKRTIEFRPNRPTEENDDGRNPFRQAHQRHGRGACRRCTVSRSSARHRTRCQRQGRGNGVAVRPAHGSDGRRPHRPTSGRCPRRAGATSPPPAPSSRPACTRCGTRANTTTRRCRMPSSSMAAMPSMRRTPSSASASRPRMAACGCTPDAAADFYALVEAFGPTNTSIVIVK